ncbi:hypothetical protein NQ318_001869 [Aromia moschata]|uniref:Helicase C-terminal domain-containing protein n=1 Tax=Aromia moschata TaxID=1265417 RepID=A0AAV8Z3C8_9CUCU|nr:hypothetical protein NQ318_001869 [Aromia moschata]
MKCLLHKRDDFKLILMSATINIQLFTDYFAEENVQVIQVPGRLYPIEIQYKPIVKDPYERKRDRFDCSPYLQILQMIDEKYPPNQKGDVLVFLNGFSEISTLADAVTEYSQHKKNWIVLPLHSTLSLEEQDKVFDYPPDGVRKCIISTNIAETSVTIDGIRFVVDSGKVNRMSYNTNLGVNKLSETNISQDSAKQRAGRAGRTGPGVCFRMYSEEDFRNFEAFTPAEIHLVPLDSLLLHMVSLGLSDISNFPFVERPATKSLEESLEKLKFTGAVELDRESLALTPPRLQKLLNEASADSHKDLTMLKLILTSGLYPQIAVEDEFNSSKTVSERLYHTKTKNYVFLRPMSYFATNPEILQLHNDDVEVPPSRVLQQAADQQEAPGAGVPIDTGNKKVYLVNTMRMPALQTLMLFAKTIATNGGLTKFVFDDFLMIDVPYFGQGKTLLLRAISLRKRWKDKLEAKLKDPLHNSEMDKKRDLLFHGGPGQLHQHRKAAASRSEGDLHLRRYFLRGEKLDVNPFDDDYHITKNTRLGGINVTENVVYNCLLQEEWACSIEEEIFNTPFECRQCNKTKMGCSVFRILQHESECARKVKEEDDVNKEENSSVVVKPNSKLHHCSEAAAVQILLETCLETPEDKIIPGRQWALQEVRSLVCSYLHQAFIADTMLCKLVHFQTYPSELLDVVIRGVPSMHICLDFLQELMQQPSLTKQIFGVQLLSHVSLQYALPKSLNLRFERGTKVRLFRPVLPALVRISEAFPPLIDDIVNLLVQLARVCESQASLASHFDAHLGKGLEIASQESAELCDLTQRTFSEILDRAVLRAKVYKQE